MQLSGCLQAGYREGITTGKEKALQAGFDDGFANVGAPIGRELGILRGIASALLPFVSSYPSQTPDQELLANEVRQVTSLLADIRFTDITPRDVEAEEHAQEHAWVNGNQSEMSEEVAAGTRIGGPEDVLSTIAAEASSGEIQRGRPTIDDVRQLKMRLEHLIQRLGLNINLS